LNKTSKSVQLLKYVLKDLFMDTKCCVPGEEKSCQLRELQFKHYTDHNPEGKVNRYIP